MARKPRNYRAEYQRRLERERTRARSEGREFSRHAARGHISPTAERAERRTRKLLSDGGLDALINATRNRDDDGSYATKVHEAIESEGLAWTLKRLRTKLAHTDQYDGPDDPGPGRNAWYSEYMVKKSYLAREIYWYHP